MFSKQNVPLSEKSVEKNNEKYYNYFIEEKIKELYYIVKEVIYIMGNVKIREIKLVNFKNTKRGNLQFPKVLNPSAKDILGIYGQNGSGKTAVIDAMEIVRTLMKGEELPKDVEHYITFNQGYAQIEVSFDIDTKENRYFVDYQLTIKKQEGDCFVETEQIKYKKCVGEKETYKKVLFKYTNSQNFPLSPKNKVEELGKYSLKETSNKIRMIVINELLRDKKGSYLFHPLFQEMIENSQEKFKDEFNILNSLRDYAIINLFIISSKNSGAIELNFFIPVNFKIKENDRISRGEIPLLLDKPTLLKDRQLEVVEKIIQHMNVVMEKIIPEMKVEILNLGKELAENKEDINEELLRNKIELISNRAGVKIPLKYESHGILKILSIISVLINVYNESGVTLLVDELDAGIFEYLLGELLDVFCAEAKGQLLFTSHNLRVLETIPKSNLIFTTTNPNNRYIKLTSVKNNNNLRDLYIRTIVLGGQSEELYQETDKVGIGKAFRKIGKEISNEQK